jgi:hypothetical protein
VNDFFTANLAKWPCFKILVIIYYVDKKINKNIDITSYLQFNAGFVYFFVDIAIRKIYLRILVGLVPRIHLIVLLDNLLYILEYKKICRESRERDMVKRTG